MTWDVIVAGGGPAGLMAAIAAAEAGARVALLERGPTLGGKLPASGGGQGNVTHSGEVADLLPHYGGGEKPGEARRFLRPALYAFSNRDLMAWLEERGVSTVEDPDGRVFPRSRKAEDVLELLLAEARTRRVGLRVGVRVGSVWVVGGGLSAFAEGARTPLARGRALVLATGGPSYGGTGDGYRIAASLGHRVVPPRPALVPLRIERRAFAPFSLCAGVALRGARVTFLRGGTRIAEREGDVLFTHRGLSGPAVLDLSRHALPGDVVRIPLLPGCGTPREAEEKILAEIASHGRRAAANLLRGLGVPGCLARALLLAAGLDPETRGAQIPRDERRRLAEGLALGMGFPVRALGGWDEAMAVAGGVALGEVDPRTLESRIVPGLFFAGEILDVDGDTGGYNLQAAFSTGFLAGKSAARRARGRSGRKVPPDEGRRPAREPDPHPWKRPQGKLRRTPRPG